MEATDPRQRRLDNLRRWRNRPPRDLTLAHLPDQIQRTVVKPHKQLGGLIDAWRDLVPANLFERTALVSLHRGVLTVHVSDHAACYELDRLLRTGLEQRLHAACKAPIRKVKCRVASL